MSTITLDNRGGTLLSNSLKLPYDAEVEYLRFSGNVSIPLGLTLPTKYFRISGKYRFITFNNSSWYTFFANYKDENSVIYRMLTDKRYSNQLLFQSYQKTSDANLEVPMTLNKWTEFCLSAESSKEYIIVNGTVYSDNYTSANANTNSFYIKNEGSNVIDWAGFDIYSDAGRYRTLIPVRVGQTGYFYDRINGNFYGTSGGTVTVGPDVVKDTLDGYEYVDLGLPSGLKWAKCNVGAYKETDCGRYYEWGSGWKSYNWGNNTGSAVTDEDGNSVMSTSGDTAIQIMGKGWRMPKESECQELIDNTNYTWVTNFNGSGINGGKFTAANGKYVFFPAAGYIYQTIRDYNQWWGIWTTKMGVRAIYFGIDVNGSSGVPVIEHMYGNYGFSIRGVHV